MVRCDRSSVLVRGLSNEREELTRQVFGLQQRIQRRDEEWKTLVKENEDLKDGFSGTLQGSRRFIRGIKTWHLLLALLAAGIVQIMVDS